MQTRTRILIGVIAGLAIAAVAAVYGYRMTRGIDATDAHIHTAADVWTCPMHPDIRESKPGKCPLCGMDLVLETPPKAAAALATSTPRAPIQLDTRRRQLLGVRTVMAESGPLAREIRAVGTVQYDETRLREITLKLGGWIKKLHVNATGRTVRQGDPLLDLYSPELVATGQEYILALATRDSMHDSQVPDARAQADRLVESARQRLLLWDLPAPAIDEIARTRKTDGTITFRSPASGIVIEKPVVEGMRADAGQTLYRLADLSAVWIEADVFEADAPFVRAGAPATVTLDAWPGERFQGRAVYVYPFVEEQTRTIKVRFAFPNHNQRLKPGMFANVTFAASIGTGITVPSDALLDAGHEHLVFVAEGDGYFQPRRVQTGQRVGDRVQITEGLAAGETVAAGAAFFLDSESQLRAAASSWDAAETPTGADAATTSSLSIGFRTVPDPPRNGQNTFEVDVTDPAGQPVTGADVRVVLYMPAMPSMNMPAMSSEVRLSPTSGGTYRGTGPISMSGRWDVTITVTRNGARLGSRQTTLVAK